MAILPSPGPSLEQGKAFINQKFAQVDATTADLQGQITEEEATRIAADEAESAARAAGDEYIQTQLDAAVFAGDSSVAAAQAAVDASGHNYGNLKLRLDTEHTGVVAQLADEAQQRADSDAALLAAIATKAAQMAVDLLEFNKADKSEVRMKNVLIGSPDITPELLSAIIGETILNLLSEPKQHSVTPDKTVFVGTSKNLFNYRNVLVGYIPNITTGALEPYAGSNTSEFVPVLPDDQYDFKLFSGAVTFYNSDFGFISGTTAAANSTITTPSGAAYMRFAVADERLKTQQVERGSVSTAYEPYFVRGEYLLGATYNPNNVAITYNAQGDVIEIEETLGGGVVKKSVIAYTNGDVSSIVTTAGTIQSTAAFVRDGDRITQVNRSHVIV